jgi:Na+-transporting methylmalonyl-CoA/oxaloacetate decarboxylase gamma subunit
MEAFSVQNIIQGNGMAISLTGMAIVFSGLIIITIFIQLLPKLLGLSFKKQQQETPSSKTTAAPATANSAEIGDDEGDDKDIASLIGLVLHLEQERLFQTENQYITMDRNHSQHSMWGITGRMRSTPHRRNYAKV